ncbi:MAG: hypothetical protein D6694_01875 [Gammaproteobacteria bacterium]|nr:MAG: hypothetical protein D6694_01875 [Gammaproteobacteria bacterium]
MKAELIRVLNFYKIFVLPEHPARNALKIPDPLSELFNFIAVLIELPDNGALFLESKNVVLNLIAAWESKTGEKFLYKQQLFEIYDVSEAGGRSSSLHGYKTKNPVYVYLMYPTLPKFKHLDENFKILSPNFLCRINQCCEQMEGASDGYRYNLCLAARKLTAAASTFPARNLFDWTYEYRLALAKAVTNAKVQGTKLTTHPDWTYIADLLFRDRTKLGRSAGGGTGTKEARWLLFERSPDARLSQDFFPIFAECDEDLNLDDGFRPVEGGRVVCPIFVHEEIKQEEVDEAGEFGIDYQSGFEFIMPASWFSDPWQAKRKVKGKQESMVASSRIAPWESSVLSIHNIQRIYRYIKSSESSPHCAILFLALFLGVPESSMKKFRVGITTDEFEPNETATEKLLNGNRYLNPFAGEMWWINSMGEEGSPGYLKVPLVLRLRLPRSMTRHLPRLKQGDKVFKQRDFSKAKKELKALGKDGFRAITLGRLNATFNAYFIHGAGLPELAADILRGTHQPHLTSQHYYITIHWAHTVREWRRIVARLICSNEKKATNILKSLAYQHDPSQTDTSSNFAGAVKTPSPELLKKHAANLLRSFPRSKRKLCSANADAWNAYIAYVYFIAGLCTGRRPQRDPFPRQDDLDLGNMSLFVDDKWNRHFREARIIPLTDFMRHILTECFELIPRCFAKWALQGFEAECEMGHAFLVDERSKRMVPVNSKTLDELCGQIDGYFVGLKNGCRHFLMTRLHQIGVEQEVIDFISGHRHASREPEMSASLVSWSSMASFLRNVIEKEVVDFLELESPFNE